MRILLFTGKGGVGKSTHAMAVAARSAAAGRRTLILSTDAAHSLADTLGVRVGPEPTQVLPNLHVHQVDAQLRFEQSWAQVQDYLSGVLEVVGVDPVAAEELTVIPGAEEVLALLEVREHARSGEWDTIVLDCAPTAETLRLLALPEALGWYMSRILPTQRRVVRALKPVLTKAAGVPMPEDDVFDAVVRLHRDLGEVHALLTGPGAGVRIVLTPEQVVLAEARRSLTLLSLFGYRVDGVVVNRIFPADSGDAWVSGWAKAQEGVMDEVADSFALLPVWRAPYAPREPVGADALLALADEVYGDHDPLAVPDVPEPLRIEREGEETLICLRVPLAERKDVRLARDGADLVVSVASYRRLLALPDSLARATVTGAAVRDGVLRIRLSEAPHGPTDEEMSER